MSIIFEPKRERQLLGNIIPLNTPFVVFLDICDKCNFRCTFCPCNTSDVSINVRHKTMSFDLFKKIVDDMKGFNNKIRVINLYAYGEPLLNPYFCDMLKYLREKEVCDEIRITSNGYLLTNKLCENIVENGLDMFRFSLYGLNDNDYYIQTGVKISYKELKSKIKYLYNYNKSHGGKLKVSIKASASFINNEIKLQQLYNEYSDISDYLYVENIDYVWPEFLFTNNYERLLFAPTKFFPNKEHTIQTSLCSFLFTHMMIFSNGDVGICNIDWKHITKYSSIIDNNIIDIWNGDSLRKLRLNFCKSNIPPIDFCISCKKLFYDNLDDDRDIIIKRLTDD